MITQKPVQFRGSSLDDLKTFPLPVRREVGHQIDQVQCGREPDNWKPMASIGSGVVDEGGAFRVIYVAKFSSAIYVRHCFQKKTQKTTKKDLEIATKRYRDLQKELGK